MNWQTNGRPRGNRGSPGSRGWRGGRYRGRPWRGQSPYFNFRGPSHPPPMPWSVPPPNWNIDQTIHTQPRYVDDYSYESIDNRSKGRPFLSPPRPKHASPPHPGSDEYLEKEITEKSAILKKQLELSETELTNLAGQSDNPSESFVKAEINTNVVSATLSNTKKHPPKRKPPTVANKLLDVSEIYSKIINHINRLSRKRKVSLINQLGSSGYDSAIERINKQKRLELSRVLRRMCEDQQERENTQTKDAINSIIPDFDISIEALPTEVVEKLSMTLNENVEEKCDFIDPEAMFKQAEQMLNTNYFGFDDCDSKDNILTSIDFTQPPLPPEPVPVPLELSTTPSMSPVTDLQLPEAIETSELQPQIEIEDSEDNADIPMPKPKESEPQTIDEMSSALSKRLEFVIEEINGGTLIKTNKNLSDSLETTVEDTSTYLTNDLPFNPRMHSNNGESVGTPVVKEEIEVTETSLTPVIHQPVNRIDDKDAIVKKGKSREKIPNSEPIENNCIETIPSSSNKDVKRKYYIKLKHKYTEKYDRKDKRDNHKVDRSHQKKWLMEQQIDIRHKKKKEKYVATSITPTREVPAPKRSLKERLGMLGDFEAKRKSLLDMGEDETFMPSTSIETPTKTNHLSSKLKVDNHVDKETNRKKTLLGVEVLPNASDIEALHNHIRKDMTSPVPFVEKRVWTTPAQKKCLPAIDMIETVSLDKFEKTSDENVINQRELFPVVEITQLDDKTEIDNGKDDYLQSLVIIDEIPETRVEEEKVEEQIAEEKLEEQNQERQIEEEKVDAGGCSPEIIDLEPEKDKDKETEIVKTPEIIIEAKTDDKSNEKERENKQEVIAEKKTAEKDDDANSMINESKVETEHKTETPVVKEKIDKVRSDKTRSKSRSIDRETKSSSSKVSKVKSHKEKSRSKSKEHDKPKSETKDESQSKTKIKENHKISGKKIKQPESKSANDKPNVNITPQVSNALDKNKNIEMQTMAKENGTDKSKSKVNESEKKEVVKPRSHKPKDKKDAHHSDRPKVKINSNSTQTESVKITTTSVQTSPKSYKSQQVQVSKLPPLHVACTQTTDVVIFENVQDIRSNDKLARKNIIQRMLDLDNEIDKLTKLRQSLYCLLNVDDEEPPIKRAKLDSIVHSDVIQIDEESNHSQTKPKRKRGRPRAKQPSIEPDEETKRTVKVVVDLHRPEHVTADSDPRNPELSDLDCSDLRERSKSPTSKKRSSRKRNKSKLNSEELETSVPVNEDSSTLPDGNSLVEEKTDRSLISPTDEDKLTKVAIHERRKRRQKRELRSSLINETIETVVRKTKEEREIKEEPEVIELKECEEEYAKQLKKPPKLPFKIKFSSKKHKKRKSLETDKCTKVFHRSSSSIDEGKEIDSIPMVVEDCGTLAPIIENDVKVLHSYVNIEKFTVDDLINIRKQLKAHSRSKSKEFVEPEVKVEEKVEPEEKVESEDKRERESEHEPEGEEPKEKKEEPEQNKEEESEERKEAVPEEKVEEKEKKEEEAEQVVELNPIPEVIPETKPVEKPKSTNFIDFQGFTGTITVLKTVSAILVAAGTSKGTIHFFDLLNGALTDSFHISTEGLTTICTTNIQDDPKVIIGSLDGYITSINTNKVVTKMQRFNEAVISTEYQWEYLFIGSRNGYLSHYSLKEDSLKSSIHLSSKSILSMKSIEEGSKKLLVMAIADAAVSVREAFTGNLLRIMQGNGIPIVESLLVERNVVYCGTRNHDILLYTFKEGDLIFKYDVENSNSVVCMQIVGELLFAGCYQGSILIYNLSTETRIGTIKRPGGFLKSMEVIDTQILIATSDGMFRAIPIPEQFLKLIQM